MSDRLRNLSREPEAPPSVHTIGTVLREWRAAERDLAELVPGSAEWGRRLSEIELLRDRYHVLVNSAKPPA